MNNNRSSGGIGFFTALGLLFIGLKLGGAIGWSWWWVLAPFWLPWAVILIILAGVFTATVLRDIGIGRHSRRSGSGSRWW